MHYGTWKLALRFNRMHVKRMFGITFNWWHPNTSAVLVNIVWFTSEMNANDQYSVWTPHSDLSVTAAFISRTQPTPDHKNCQNVDMISTLPRSQNDWVFMGRNETSTENPLTEPTGLSNVILTPRDSLRDYSSTEPERVRAAFIAWQGLNYLTQVRCFGTFKWHAINIQLFIYV